MNPTDDTLPTLSIGLAVRNAEQAVKRCIASILSQDFTDFELIICDNASNDNTVALLRNFECADRRIKVRINRINIGSHENMNRVLEYSRGRFFRWISADDWLEPKCLSACVNALENRPDAVGVTTWFTIHTPGGQKKYEEYRGEFPDSLNPAERFDRMLWFFHAGDGKYDPIYGMYRRDCLVRSQVLRPSERTDWLLSAELALMGPIIHLDQRLANRTRSYPIGIDRAAFRRRLDPIRGEQLRTSPTRLYREFAHLAASAHLSKAQLSQCKMALWRFWVKELIRVNRTMASDARHRILRRG